MIALFILFGYCVFLDSEYSFMKSRKLSHVFFKHFLFDFYLLSPSQDLSGYMYVCMYVYVCVCRSFIFIFYSFNFLVSLAELKMLDNFTSNFLLFHQFFLMVPNHLINPSVLFIFNYYTFNFYKYHSFFLAVQSFF